MQRDYLVLQSRVVHRPRLDSLLAMGLEYGLLAVSAGPGYGKTTAITHFCQGFDDALAWLNLLAPDNHSDRFWFGFTAALGREDAQLAAQLAGMPFPESTQLFGAFLQAIASAPRRLLLVLDSVENILSPQVRGFINSLIDAAPAGVKILVSGNNRQSVLGLVGDRPHHQLGPAELAFTDRETDALFKNYGQRLSPARLEQVQQQTIGWPIALYLLASRPELQGPSLATPAHIRVLSGLFQHNYYAGFEPEVRKLLVKLSYFPRIPPGLIKAIGEPDVSRAFKALSNNIFIEYNYIGHYFHFQKLYRDFLALKQPTLDRQDTQLMLTQAGCFFRQQGLYGEAMDCFWQVADYDGFVQAVLDLPPQNRPAAETNLILSRLESIPADYSAQNPAVDFCRGFMYLNVAKIAKAGQIFTALAQRLEQDTAADPEDGLLGNTYTALADVALAQNSLQALDYAGRAVALLPGGAKVRAPQVMAVGNQEVFFLPDSQPGRMAEMAEFPRRLDRCAAQLYGDSGKGFPCLFAAEGAYHAGRFGDVIEYSLKAVHMAKGARQHDIVANALYLQMRLSLFLGEADKAANTLEEICAYVDDSGAPLGNLRDCAQALYAIALNDIENIPPQFLARGLHTPEAPLETGRDKIIIAFSRHLCGDHEGAYSALLELESVFAERRLWGTRLTSHLLKAECLRQMGQPHKAITQFGRAAQMAASNGIVTPLAEFGVAIPPLVELAVQQQQLALDPAWAAQVLNQAMAMARRRQAMMKIARRPFRQSSPGPALTRREVQVLEHLAQGLNREEIAGMLNISVHGVKKHIANIYTKLGALNRADAVNIAISHGIISAE